jgi:spermidine synthase
MTVPVPRPIFLVYLASGAISLGYQVAWFRIYVDRFGSTTLTFALVVCNFIAGLGLGALVSRPLCDAVGRRIGSQDRLRVYGVIELGIALAALLTPLAVLVPGDLLGSFPYALVDGVYEPSAAWHAMQLGLAFLCVFLPCFLMGTTYPLLCSAFPEDERFPSALYAWNTLGAALGVLACEFLLLPTVGHDATLYSMVAASAALGVLALVLGERLARRRAPIAPAPVVRARSARDASPAAIPAGGVGFLTSVAILSGLVSGVLEGDAFKRIEFLDAVFNAALSFVSFWAIVGIFLGSFAARTLPGWNLARVRILYALALAWQIGLWSFAYPLRDALFWPDLVHLWLFVGAFVLPPFLLVSPLLPWACDRLHASRRHLGLAYGLNTVAFCVGILISTHWAPAVSIFYSLKLAPVLLLAALVLLLLLREGGRVAAWKPAVAVGGAALGALLVPRAFDAHMFAPDNFARRHPVSEMRADAAHTTFVVDVPDGRVLQFESHPMSGTNLRARTYMQLMAHVPLLCQERPRSALLICFGVGNTAAAIAAHGTIERFDVVDLSREVIATAPAFADTNDRVFEDPRARWIHDDGRNWLGTCDEVYDLVTSEPPPPMNAGVYRLYSVEYYRSVLEHLSPQGLMSQWLPVYQMPERAIELAISTFLAAFPQALVFAGYEDELILVGGRKPCALERVAARLASEPRVRAQLARLEVHEPIQLVLRVLQLEPGLRARYAGRGVVSDQRNDLAHLFVRLDAPAAVPYDAQGVRAGLLARSVPERERIERCTSHLGLLVGLVRDFPAGSLAALPAAQRATVELGGIDWRAHARLRRQALTALAAGRLEEGLSILDRMLVPSREQPAVLWDRARALAALGRRDQARTAYDELLALEPANSMAARERDRIVSGG